MDEITTKEFSIRTGISERTIRNMIARGAITARLERTDPTVKKGVWKIQKSEVKKVIDFFKQERKSRSPK